MVPRRKTRQIKVGNVAIGGDVGLLGQDIYGGYGISMGSDAIHLYP